MNDYDRSLLHEEIFSSKSFEMFDDMFIKLANKELINEELTEYFEERAAILEFDGGHTEEEASRLARIETEKFAESKGYDINLL